MRMERPTSRPARARDAFPRVIEVEDQHKPIQDVIAKGGGAKRREHVTR